MLDLFSLNFNVLFILIDIVVYLGEVLSQRSVSCSSDELFRLSPSRERQDLGSGMKSVSVIKALPKGIRSGGLLPSYRGQDSLIFLTTSVAIKRCICIISILFNAMKSTCMTIELHQ